jgi:hypothetical protein
MEMIIHPGLRISLLPNRDIACYSFFIRVKVKCRSVLSSGIYCVEKDLFRLEKIVMAAGFYV